MLSWTLAKTQQFKPKKKKVIVNRFRIGHLIVTHGYLMGKTKPPIWHSWRNNVTYKLHDKICTYSSTVQCTQSSEKNAKF